MDLGDFKRDVGVWRDSRFIVRNLADTEIWSKNRKTEQTIIQTPETLLVCESYTHTLLPSCHFLNCYECVLDFALAFLNLPSISTAVLLRSAELSWISFSLYVAVLLR